jgi:hypothetical protein
MTTSFPSWTSSRKREKLVFASCVLTTAIIAPTFMLSPVLLCSAQNSSLRHIHRKGSHWTVMQPSAYKFHNRLFS